MSQLFGGRSGGGTSPLERLERELALLEEQAQHASPGYETQFLNRAGNLCVEAGAPRRALSYYGRAIDAYLESGRFSAAEVLCNKVLQISPDAVRARCTLVWLSIGKGYQTGTDQELATYVRAAEKAGMEELAAKQLRMMAEATASTRLRELIGEHLLNLGAFAESEWVLGAVHQERNQLRDPASADEGKLWSRLLRAALMSPEELQEQTSGSEYGGDQALPSLS